MTNSEGRLERLWKYIREGPEVSEHPRGRMAGMLLWWRTWTLLLLYLASVAVLFGYMPPNAEPRMWGYVVGSAAVIGSDIIFGDFGYSR